MARVTFTQDQLAQAKLVAPNWYPMVVKSYAQEQASTDGSDNHIFTLVIEGENPFKGVSIRLLGNEKWYSGEFVEFLELTQGELKAGVPIEMERSVGKRDIEGFVQRREPKSGGRAQNAIVAFRRKKPAA